MILGNKPVSVKRRPNDYHRSVTFECYWSWLWSSDPTQVGHSIHLQKNKQTNQLPAFLHYLVFACEFMKGSAEASTASMEASIAPMKAFMEDMKGSWKIKQEASTEAIAKAAMEASSTKASVKPSIEVGENAAEATSVKASTKASTKALPRIFTLYVHGSFRSFHESSAASTKLRRKNFVKVLEAAPFTQKLEGTSTEFHVSLPWKLLQLRRNLSGIHDSSHGNPTPMAETISIVVE